MTTEPDTIANARAPEGGAGSVLTAVLANRFETIVREMTNTLFRAGRSSVLNTARDFSCCIVTADDSCWPRPRVCRRTCSAPGCRRAGCGACTPTSPRATPSCTTIPTSATRTRPTTRCWSRSSSTASTSSPSRRRPTRPTAATPRRRTYMPFAARRLRGRRAHLPLRPRAARLQDIDDIIRMCRARIRVPDAVVRRLPRGARRGARRRARGLRSWPTSTASRPCGRSSATGSTTPSGG